MREGYASLFENEEDLTVAGSSPTAEEAIGRVLECKPDVVLVDLSLPGMNGIELVKQLRAVLPSLPILVVSAHDESLYAERALLSGARGYIMKHESAARVVDAIRDVVAGKLYVGDQLRDRLILKSLTPSDVSEEPTSALSDRELEVFEHFGRGRSTQEIADRMSLSPKTIESHRVNIKRKLGIERTNELIQRAVLHVESLLL